MDRKIQFNQTTVQSFFQRKIPLQNSSFTFKMIQEVHASLAGGVMGREGCNFKVM